MDSPLSNAAPAPTEALAEAINAEQIITDENQAPAAEAPQSDDELLAAAFDRATEGPQEAESEPQEAESVAEAPEAAAEADDASGEQDEPEQIEIPTDMPAGLKKHWSSLSDDARNDIMSSHREMANKTSAAMREVKGLAPIKDVLIQSIQMHPALAEMQPGEVAQQIPALIQAGQRLKSDPVGGIMHLIQQHGVGPHIAQALGGNVDGAAMQQEVARLREQVDPRRQEAQINRVIEQERTQSVIAEFSQGKEHWSAVEDHLPQFVELAKRQAGPQAPAKALLEAAYDMALRAIMPDKAPTHAAADEAAAKPDPELEQKARQAKSVNVSGRKTGKQRPMTEGELLSAAYDRASKA